MFGHRCFLIIGGGEADILSLINGGYELVDFDFVFEQGIDDKGKATTRVYAGTINLTISQLPSPDIIEWALNSRKYEDGFIVMLDANNIPLEKTYFKHAACVNMEINYTQVGNSYAATKLKLVAGQISVGSGIEFTNEWAEY